MLSWDGGGGRDEIEEEWALSLFLDDRTEKKEMNVIQIIWTLKDLLWVNFAVNCCLKT